MGKITSNTFKVGGGRTVIRHKSNWPDCLSIEMSRYDAWDFVNDLINQLRDEERAEIRFSSCGKLDTDIEE